MLDNGIVRYVLITATCLFVTVQIATLDQPAPRVTKADKLAVAGDKNSKSAH